MTRLEEACETVKSKWGGHSAVALETLFDEILDELIVAGCDAGEINRIRDAVMVQQ